MAEIEDRGEVKYFLSLLWIWRRLPKRLSYRQVNIPKGKEGKFRTLHIPNEELMGIQQRILKGVLYKLPVSQAAHCAVPHRSVVTNAEPHSSGKAFFKIDFKDAFPSVSKKMVVEHLVNLFEEKFPNFPQGELKNFVSLLSTFTIYKDSLPQGAPTSPYLLNLVCFRLDAKLIKMAGQYGLNYTRYADDLCFSSREAAIPVEARKLIIKTIIDYGFTINRRKVRYRTGKATVPKIAGVALIQKNGKQQSPSLPRNQIEAYRAKIHRAITDQRIDPAEIFGIIGWVTMITPNQIPKRLKKPLLDFFSKRCPDKLGRYVHLL